MHDRQYEISGNGELSFDNDGMTLLVCDIHDGFSLKLDWDEVAELKQILADEIDKEALDSLQELVSRVLGPVSAT